MIDKIFSGDGIGKVLAKISPQYSTSDTENLIKGVLEASLAHPETRVTHQVQTEVYYLANASLEYYIKLDRVSITISNHTYTYKEGLSEQFCKILYKELEAYTVEKVKQFENDVFANKTDLLTRIRTQLQIKS